MSGLLCLLLLWLLWLLWLLLLLLLLWLLWLLLLLWLSDAVGQNPAPTTTQHLHPLQPQARRCPRSHATQHLILLLRLQPKKIEALMLETAWRVDPE